MGDIRMQRKTRHEITFTGISDDHCDDRSSKRSCERFVRSVAANRCAGPGVSTAEPSTNIGKLGSADSGALIAIRAATRCGISRNAGDLFAPMGVSVPIAVSAFPDEIYQLPRSWAERAYPKLIHYNKLDKGGHFAAWEQPKFLSEEVRAGFRSLRT